MGGRHPHTTLAGIASTVLLLGAAWTHHAQGAEQHESKRTPQADVTTTKERIDLERWWPTMSTASLSEFAGSKDCVGCHREMSSGEHQTAMQNAAALAADSSLMQELPLSFDAHGSGSVSRPLTYGVRASATGAEYVAADGIGTRTQTLSWIMGAGDLGQTFVYQRDGRWYQSRMSAYRKPPKLDITTGLKMDESSDLDAALGSALTQTEVRRCFSCHTVHATSSRGFNPLHAEAGLGCEACHGPGAVHAAKMQSSNGPGADLAIFNPSALSPVDSIDFCGSCHRSFGDVTEEANQANDSSTVRFQPYRLEKSRCWRETQDARLTCVACHDPHAPLDRVDADYDQHCLGCHQAGAVAQHASKVCPTGAKTKCVSCHMPKVAVASMHGEFTDHFIRVVKADGVFVP